MDTQDNHEPEVRTHSVQLLGDRTISFMRVDGKSAFMRWMPDVWFKSQNEGLSWMAVMGAAPLEDAYQQARALQRDEIVEELTNRMEDIEDDD